MVGQIIVEQGMHKGTAVHLKLADLPPHVREVAQVIHEGGFGVWIVGGALRDLLRGKPPKDWDVTTTASPHVVTRLFPRVFPVGIRHGTVMVRTGGATVEVTSCGARGEHGDIFADLARRDFTMNAMAVAYPSGKLLDPFQGRRDLQRGVLRAVADAAARFTEDPLRVLRGCRLVGQYGFRIHRDTFRALRTQAPRLQFVAPERIRDEVFKLILGRHLVEAFQCLCRGGVLEQVLPELPAMQGRSEKETPAGGLLHSIDLLTCCPERLSLRLAALFHRPPVHFPRDGAGPPNRGAGFQNESAHAATRVLQRWRSSNRQSAAVNAILKHQLPDDFSQWDDGAIRRFLAAIEPELLEDVLLLSRARFMTRADGEHMLKAFHSFGLRVQSILSSGELVMPGQLAINGEDVMNALGLSPGPLVGMWLKKLHGKVLQDPALNERKILVDFLRKTELYKNGS